MGSLAEPQGRAIRRRLPKRYAMRLEAVQFPERPAESATERLTRFPQ